MMAGTKYPVKRPVPRDRIALTCSFF